MGYVLTSIFFSGANYIRLLVLLLTLLVSITITMIIRVNSHPAVVYLTTNPRDRVRIQFHARAVSRGQLSLLFILPFKLVDKCSCDGSWER